MKTFFIAGLQRSGTTLLSVLLSKHPDILLERRSIAFRIITCFKSMYNIQSNNLEVDKNDFVKWLVKNDSDGRLAELIDYKNFDSDTDIRTLINRSIQDKLKANNKKIWVTSRPTFNIF